MGASRCRASALAGSAPAGFRVVTPTICKLWVDLQLAGRAVREGNMALGCEGSWNRGKLPL